ncbi:hypothetical protein LCGC14_0334430 [marine sediment metagenome]|uniref:Tail sheath protein subtilisin-like domain-containing protein n=1 Tax=marine sediment metagenome TaxID=412755 RepID=A0A0F9TFD9_9ZZZZ
MAQKRFGPTRGAGVAIVEVEGQKTIQPGALGMVGYTGILEKGPVGELISVFSKQEFFKVCGGLIPDSLLPDAAEDYFDNAAGAGGMHLVRVTDGNEVQSELTLYSRIAATRTAMGTVKAANGGRWGGKKDVITDSLANPAGYTELTIITGKTFTADQLKGGIVTLDDVPNKTFEIVGNTVAGVITVAAGSTMLTDLGANDPARYNVELDNLLPDGETKALSILIEDGEENPDTEFALTVFVDGVEVKKYANLHTDPVNGRYWVALINDDTNNDEIFVVDLVTGTHVAATRPANHYGVSTVSGIAATVLTAEIHDVTFNVTDVEPAVTLGTTNDVMLEQVITITFSSATAFTVVSDRFGSLGAAGTTGAEFVPDNKFTPPFTVAPEATLVLNDTIIIQYKPFIPGSLVDGFLFPDKAGATIATNNLLRFRITANTHNTINVALGSDMQVGTTDVDEFLVEAPQELAKGQDGISDVDADFITQGYDVETSPFNRLFGKNFGLIKMATPGNTATAVQKAGVAYAASRNYQYRNEIPPGIVTETAAIDFINGATGVGRSIYAVVSFPSFGDVTDQASRDGKLKQVSLTGQIHGREAAIVRDNDGYQKAQAGLEATLPALLDIPTKDKVLNEELLNPVGIGVIKKVKGNFIIWGDRTLFDDPEWKFKHQRELMSFYENVLREEFDFIIFAINDPANDAVAISALNGFFRPEFVKRALRGATFQEAAIIKIDSENNPDSSRAQGDLIADISLKLADTVERFIIRIGKQGIFDQVG